MKGITTIKPKKGAVFNIGKQWWRITDIEAHYKKGQWIVVLAPARGKK